MYLNLPHENLKLTIGQEKIFVSMFKEKGRRGGRERREEEGEENVPKLLTRG